MKRRFKKLYSVVAIALMCAITVMSVGATADNRIYDQTAAIAANDLLWQTFEFGENGMPISYPEEYGGAYIEKGLLYIYIVGLDDELIAKYNDICDNSPAIRFVEAEYSLNYLESLSAVAEQMTDTYDVTAYGADIRNNRFSIEIDDSKDNINTTAIGSLFAKSPYDLQHKEIKEQLNNDAITIKPGAYMDMSSQNLIGGDRVFPTNSDGTIMTDQNGNQISFSFGFGGTYNGTPALLTAGHCVTNPIGDGEINVTLIKYDNSVIGYPSRAQFEDDGSGDWAIISLTDSTFIATNDVYAENMNYTRNITRVTNSYAPGQYLQMFGMQTGYHLCILESYNVTYHTAYYGEDGFNPDIAIHGLCTSTSVSLTSNGDSGGTVYSYDSTNGYAAFGTITGEYYANTNDDESLIIFSPIHTAISAGFTPLFN